MICGRMAGTIEPRIVMRSSHADACGFTIIHGANPNLRKTEVIRAKEKAAAGAAAAGDAPRKPPPKKRGADAEAATEEKVKTPAEQEVEKLDKLLGLAGAAGAR